MEKKYYYYVGYLFWPLPWPKIHLDFFKVRDGIPHIDVEYRIGRGLALRLTLLLFYVCTSDSRLSHILKDKFNKQIHFIYIIIITQFYLELRELLKKKSELLQIQNYDLENFERGNVWQNLFVYEKYKMFNGSQNGFGKKA